MGRTVLVTGVSRYLGGRMAALLASDPTISDVIGVDVVAPESPIPGTEFVRADIRNPVIAKVMGEAGVDTVVHMGVIATPKQAGGRSTMKEINVIGTMQLLAACQRTPSVRSLVVKSTAAVYGSGPKDPAKFTEDMEPRHSPSSGWPKDSVEVETYVRGFARRRPDVCVTTLRFANFIGPRVQTALTSYFSMPFVPTVLGFDPRLQFVHEDDGLEAIRTAVLSPRQGTFNIAGDGVLMLSQAARRSRRPTFAVPGLLFGPLGRSLSPTGLADFSPEAVRYLTYGRALDTRAMNWVLGFQPVWTSEDAFMSFVHRNDEIGEVDVA
jgi:UDP-glucose 4-epimerase